MRRPWSGCSHQFPAELLGCTDDAIDLNGVAATAGGIPCRPGEVARIDGYAVIPELLDAWGPDITMTDPEGRTYYEQVGKSPQCGMPIKREWDGLDDIERGTGVRSAYTPYDR